MKDLFIFAGEASGDLHGEKVLQELLLENPTLSVWGVGGPKMRALGMECLLPMEEFQVMGFLEVFKSLPKLMRHFYTVRNAILQNNPKKVLLIDYPGFTLRLAGHLRKKGFTGKIYHYICPSVWIYGKKRIAHMAATLDHLLTIFPFEAKFFAHTSLPVHYIGHPLLERLKGYTYQPLPPCVALFPGSRTKEIDLNFPLYLRVAKRLLKDFPTLHFAVSLSHPSQRTRLQKIMQKEGLTLPLIEPQNTYDLMRACTLAIAKSGTVTLELALHQVPTIVTYAITPIDLFIAKNLLRIDLPHYCIVNILYKETVFPELIGPHFSEDALLQNTQAFLTDPSLAEKCRKICQTLPQLLGKGEKRIAEVIWNPNL